MARPKKDGETLSLYIDRAVKERLQQYCAETGQTKTMAIERMLTEELNKYFAQPKGKRIPIQ